MTTVDSESAFVPGIELSRRFYGEAVRPLLRRKFRGLPYSAGLLGTGSEVLGFDTPRSRDHAWGPRLLLFLSEVDLELHGSRMNDVLAAELPRTVAGYPTNFTEAQADGSRLLRYVNHGPINHGVEITTLSTFLTGYIGIANPLQFSDYDWLTTSQQRLRTLTHGAVFHDDLAVLVPMRAALEWYPDHLWRALLAAQWGRIGQEEAFPGRCAEAGDDLGSRIITSRLVRDLMLLCFLMERSYAPYSKWLGTAFAQLDCAPRYFLTCRQRSPPRPGYHVKRRSGRHTASSLSCITI